MGIRFRDSGGVATAPRSHPVGTFRPELPRVVRRRSVRFRALIVLMARIARRRHAFEYGIQAATPSEINASSVRRPVLQWSPDSRGIAIQRMDQRNVGLMPLYSVTHERPKLYPYPLPGDSIIPRFDIHIVDVASKSNVRVNVEPQPRLTFTTTGLADSTWLTLWPASRTGT